MIEWVYDKIFGEVLDKLFDDYFEQIANRTKENYPGDPLTSRRWSRAGLKSAIDQSISNNDVLSCGYAVVNEMVSDKEICNKVISEYGFEKSLQLYCDSTNACVTSQNIPTVDQIAKYVLNKDYAPTLDEVFDDFVEFVYESDDYDTVISNLYHNLR